MGFNSGNSGLLESTQEYLEMTRESYRNDSGMTQEYLGDSGRVWDMTVSIRSVNGDKVASTSTSSFWIHM